jgi:hemerythrin
MISTPVDSMQSIEWKETYKVRIAVIDDQHQMLFEMTKNMFDAMHEGMSTEIVMRNLPELILFSASHFRTEEMLFQRYEYPNKEEHIIEHRRFMEKVKGYHRNYTSGSFFAIIDLVNFLQQWFTTHIPTMDHDYSEYILEKARNRSNSVLKSEPVSVSFFSNKPDLSISMATVNDPQGMGR